MKITIENTLPSSKGSYKPSSINRYQDYCKLRNIEKSTNDELVLAAVAKAKKECLEEMHQKALINIEHASNLDMEATYIDTPVIKNNKYYTEDTLRSA